MKKSCYDAILESTSKLKMASPDPASIDLNKAVDSAVPECSNASKYDSNLEAVDLDIEPDFADPSDAPPFSELGHDILHDFRGTSAQHPRDFRMQLIPSDGTGPNEELEDIMTRWYNKYYFLVDRPTFTVLRSSYYAAYLPSRDRWVRGWTCNNFADDAHEESLLDVELIDHGMLWKVEKRHLLLLRRKYLDLPIQAFRGRLELLAEEGKKWEWTPAVRDQFAKDVIGECFCGLVTGCYKYWPPSPYLTVHLIMFYEILEKNDAGVVEEKLVLYQIKGLKCGYKKVDPKESSRLEKEIPVINGDEDEAQVATKMGTRLLTLLQKDGYSETDTESEKILASYKRNFD